MQYMVMQKISKSQKR